MSNELKQNVKILDINSAINMCINMHPTLYNGKTFEDSKLKVLNHLFNVIGNGIRELEDFIERFQYNECYTKHYETPKKEYTNGTPLYRLYTEVEKKFDDFLWPKPDSLLEGAYSEEDLINVEYEVKIPVSFHEFHPYPNFKKEYSTIWKFSEIFDKDWLLNIKWFYEKCLDYHKSDRIYSDFQAIPKDFNNPKWEVRIEEQIKSFNRTSKKRRSWDESFEECISREYGCEYTGDVKDFIIRRFIKENDRRISFIEETIEYVNTLIKGLDSNEYEL